VGTLAAQLRGALAFARRTLHQADRHNILFLASALTFDGLLTAIPFLLLLLVGLTHVAELSSSSTVQDLHQLFQRFVPPATADDGAGPFAGVERFLMGFLRARAKVSLFALPLFLWFATRLFASVRTSLTLVYDAPRRPADRHWVHGYVMGKLRDMMMVVLTVALLLVNAALSAGLKVLGARGHELVTVVPSLRFFVSGLGYVLTEITAFAFSVSLFYLVYRHASPRRLPRRAALAGSLFTAGLFEVAKRFYGWYLLHLAVANRFSADASTGAAILFVLWLYYTALVFLIGAVVAETWDLWTRQRGGGLQPIQLAG
jgi:membrane protein